MSFLPEEKGKQGKAYQAFERRCKHGGYVVSFDIGCSETLGPSDQLYQVSLSTVDRKYIKSYRHGRS